MKTFKLWIQRTASEPSNSPTLQQRNSNRVPSITACDKPQSTRLSRVLCFLHQANSCTMKCREPELPYQDTVFSCSPNASRGPSRHSAPISVSELIRTALTLARTSLRQIQAEMSTVRDTAPISFPFNGFTRFFTLFSKYFSSFPHGTCSLSVSCPYLALDEIYHPFWAAFPNNPTLRKRPVEEARHSLPDTGFSPSLMPRSRELGQRLPPTSASINYNSLELPLEISNLSFSRFTRRY